LVNILKKTITLTLLSGDNSGLINQ